MQPELTLLAGIAGRWEGEGVNHEGQAFHGVLVAEPPLNASGFQLAFTATGADGALYHRETLLIGQTPDGTIAISASNNIPGLVRFIVESATADELVLALGAAADFSIFSERIILRREAEDRLVLSYRWAMPGEPIQDRSAVTLRRL